MDSKRFSKPKDFKNSTETESKEGTNCSLFDISSTDCSISTIPSKSDSFFSVGEVYKGRQSTTFEESNSSHSFSEDQFETDYGELEVARNESDPVEKDKKKKEVPASRSTKSKCSTAEKRRSVLTGLEASYTDKTPKSDKNRISTPSSTPKPSQPESSTTPKKTENISVRSILTGLENSYKDIMDSSLIGRVVQGVVDKVVEKTGKSESTSPAKDTVEKKPRKEPSVAMYEPPHRPIALVMVDESTGEDGIYGFGGKSPLKPRKKQNGMSKRRTKNKKKKMPSFRDTIPCYSAGSDHDSADDATVISSINSSIADTPKNIDEHILSPKLGSMEILINNARHVVCAQNPSQNIVSKSEHDLITQELSSDLDFLTALNVLRSGIQDDDYDKLVEQYIQDCKLKAIQKLCAAEAKDKDPKNRTMEMAALYHLTEEAVKKISEEERQRLAKTAERKERQHLDNIHRNISQILKESNLTIMNEFSSGEKLKSKVSRCQTVNTFEDLKKDLHHHTENEMRKIARRIVRRIKKGEFMPFHPEMTSFDEPRNRMDGPDKDTVSSSMEVPSDRSKLKKSVRKNQKKKKKQQKLDAKSDQRDVRTIREPAWNSDEKTLNGIASIESMTLRDSAHSRSRPKRSERRISDSRSRGSNERTFDPKTRQKRYEMNADFKVDNVIDFVRSSFDFWKKKEASHIKREDTVDIQFNTRLYDTSKGSGAPKQKQGGQMHAIGVDHVGKNETIVYGYERRLRNDIQK